WQRRTPTYELHQSTESSTLIPSSTFLQCRCLHNALPLCRGLRRKQNTTTGAHPQKGESERRAWAFRRSVGPAIGRRSQTACCAGKEEPRGERWRDKCGDPASFFEDPVLPTATRD